MTQLHLDLNAATEYLHTPWSFGVNVSSAAALLRKDVQRHLLMGRDECGFRHVRLTGLFHPAMNVVNEEGGYDFGNIERVIDWLVEQGLAPYIELGSPHLNDETAVDLARALAAFIDGRFGCDTQEWHFELAAPGHAGVPGSAPSSGSPFDAGGTPSLPATYRSLYDRTARAIKSVNRDLKMGGPASADVFVIDAFLAHVAEPSETFGLDVQRCDYLSVVGPHGGELDAWSARVADVRQKLTTVLGENVPLIVCSYGPAEPPSAETPSATASPENDACNDACAAGSYVAAFAATLGRHAEGAMYASISDADQPIGALIQHEPFHGGRGLVTVNDVRKASFNALKLLHEHAGFYMGWEWKEPTPGVYTIVTRDYHNVVRVVATYVPRPIDADATNATPSPQRASFTLEGLPESVQWGQVQVIRPANGSPLETWEEQGRPQFVYRYLLDDLESASHPAVAEVNFKDFPPRLEPGMTLQLTIPLPEDVLQND